MSLDKGLIAVTLFSMLLYIYDVGSDIALAIAYSKEDNHTVEFGITTAYIVAPAVIYNAICAYFIRVESSSLDSYALCQIICTFPLLLGPLVMYVPFCLLLYIY